MRSSEAWGRETGLFLWNPEENEMRPVCPVPDVFMAEQVAAYVPVCEGRQEDPSPNPPTAHWSRDAKIANLH